MLETISECADFLAKELSEVRPCTALTFGNAHFVRVRLWQGPIGLWTESFFIAVGNRSGSFVESDIAIKSHHRADYTRILIRMHHPLLQCFTMTVDVNGTSCIIMVEKDDVSFDYSTVYDMPSTPWEVYNSEDDGASEEEDESDDETKNLLAKIDDVRPSRNDNDYEFVVDVDSNKEDKVYRDDRMEGLHVLKLESPSKMEAVASEAKDDGGLEASPEAAVVQVMSPTTNLTRAVF